MNGDVSNSLPTQEYIHQLLNILTAILSTLMISGINIAISGHILSYVFSFKKNDEKGNKKSHFTLPIPFILRISINGNAVFAGFAAYTLSLLCVGALFPGIAELIFIQRLQATDNLWLANQSLAAGVSVIGCLFLGAIRMLWLLIVTHLKVPHSYENLPSPQQRVEKLTEIINDK